MDGAKPLAALPNIGLASLAGGRVIFPHASPDYFAEFAAHARELGAKIIGGCCGTTPVEIAAIRDGSRGRAQAAHAARLRGARAVRPPSARSSARPGSRKALREGEWIVSVQLDPPLGGNISGPVELAQALKDSGRVGFVDVNDNAGARAGMSSIMVSVRPRARGRHRDDPAPDDARLHRDGPRVAMLFGAHAEGVRNVLAVTGDPPGGRRLPGLARRLRGRLRSASSS